MSAIKRTRRHQADEASALSVASPLPASKRLKTTSPHVPAAPNSGLGFLIDDRLRTGKKLDAKLTNGVPGNKTTRVDESQAVVVPQTGAGAEQDKSKEVIDISSGEESSDYEEEEEQQALLTNGHAEDEDMEDASEAAEPSFGDMLQARHPGQIDVHASFADPTSALTTTNAAGTRVLAPPPSTTSLGTVLTQALKTNDRDLLESCFQVTDLPSIRATIQRLASPHVTTLLQRLAERIHKRPGRTGNLMVWVQWSLVAHGGYLASQPELMKQLRSLARVVRERAAGLQPLLQLKGKLDLLGAQLDLRRGGLEAARAANGDDDDDEEAVLYIEGQDDDEDEEDWSENDDEDDEETAPRKLLKAPRSTKKSRSADANDVIPNGVGHDSGSDESADEDESVDGNDLLDIEADEDDDASSIDEDEDSGAPDESDSEEGSEEEDDEESESDDGGVRQPAPKTLNRKR